jgi:hypothetical protein
MAKQMNSLPTGLYPYMPNRSFYVNTEHQCREEDDDSEDGIVGDRWFVAFVRQLGFPEGTTPNDLAVALVDAALDKKSDNVLVNTASAFQGARQSFSQTAKAAGHDTGLKVRAAGAVVSKLLHRVSKRFHCGPATEEGTVSSASLVVASASLTLTENTTATSTEGGSFSTESLGAEETEVSFLPPADCDLPREIGDRRPLLVIDNADHWSQNCNAFFLKLASEAYTRKVVVLIATTSKTTANKMCKLNGNQKVTACPGTYNGVKPDVTTGNFAWNDYGWTSESRLEHLQTKYGDTLDDETFEQAAREATIREAVEEFKKLARSHN